MLKFKRNEETDTLSGQFEGLDLEGFEKSADTWVEAQHEVQDVIKTTIEKQVKEDDMEKGFDVSIAMEVFFKHFNTEELQQVALVQLLAKDFSERSDRVVQELMFGGGGLSQILSQLGGSEPEEDNS